MKMMKVLKQGYRGQGPRGQRLKSLYPHFIPLIIIIISRTYKVKVRNDDDESFETGVQGPGPNTYRVKVRNDDEEGCEIGA